MLQEQIPENYPANYPALGQPIDELALAEIKGAILAKLRLARTRIEASQQRTGRRILLEVDGGIKIDNIAAAARAGADTFVAGSAIFGAPDYPATIARMRAELAAVR